jgi:mono/diheme cytochrome c family protein
MKIKILVTGILIFAIFVFIVFIYANKDLNDRWYTKEQVSSGKEVFSKNCASCHGYNAEKTLDWKKNLADGSYPAPPLNDKAHAWYHPKWQLMEIITNGGASYDGKMPAFKDKLTLQEKDAAISYFQSFWSDEFYNLWVKNGGLQKK